MVSVSVIVTTFRRPDALGAVLSGLARQSDRAFETIVADDGSGPETAEVIRRFASRFPDGLIHAWHPDRGFRAAGIRNHGISVATGSYVVFLDGDSIPRPGFVAAHRGAARPGWSVRGRRVLLSAALTREVLCGRADPAVASLGELCRWRSSGDLNRLVPMLIGLPSARRMFGFGLHWRHLRTVNFAAWRDDLMRVNGFDGRFVGWGSEDSELGIRLARAGVRLGDLPGSGIVFHLHHPPSERVHLAENLARLRATERSGPIRAEVGLDRVDPDARVEHVR